MKKYLSYIWAFAAAAITISSCEQTEINAPEDLTKDGFRYEFVINDENSIDESTKATLSSTGVAWEEDDRVGMFLEGYTGYAEINMENTPRTVILYSTAVIPANSYAYAYYPWSDGNSDKTATKIVLPHVQSGSSQSAMPLAGVPFKVETEAEAKSKPNGEINFMNLGSIIDFKVYSANYDDEVIDYITFTATNSGAVVAGDGYLDLTAVNQNDENTLELTFGLGDDYDNVKVHNANTAVAPTKDAANSIYMVLNPGTYSGTITIGTDKATYTFNFTDKTLVRNQVRHYNMNLGNAVRGPKDLGAVSLPYTETFATDEGEFVTDGVKANNVDVWQFATGYGMKATSSFNSGANNYAATSWLTSPWIDLTTVAAASVSFDHVHRYAGTKENEFTLWVLTDEANADWVQLTIPNWATGSNWTFVNSGEISLTDYVGKNVKLGFKYIGTTTTAGTWEIKNFSVVEKVYTTEFTMDSDEITVEVGKTKNNNVIVNSGATITYSSDDDSIATVAADGTVTGVAEGDTYINVHVDANAGYPAKDDLFEVHVIPASSYKSFTWDLSIDETVSASTTALNWNYRGVTMAAAKGTAGTATNNYYPGTSGHSYTSTRFYSGSTLTITPYTGSTIGYVEFTATTHSYATALKNSTWSNATTSMENGDAVTLVTVTPDNGNNAFSATIGATCGFTAVTVYYTGDLVSVASYPVTFTQPSATGCSFTVSVGGSPIDSEDVVESGTTVTLAATTGTGYEFTSWTVEGATVANASAETTTFVMGSSAVSISATFTQLVTNTVTFSQSTGGTFTVSVDDSNITSGASVQQGKTVTLTATANSGYVFSSWTVTGATVSGNTTTATFTMGTNPVTVAATFEASEGTTDLLDREFTGVSSGSSTYSNWSAKSGSASDAVYAGNSAGSNNAIQLRSNTNSGIVSTASGGYVKKVKVTWESHTVSGRTLNVYGNNTAYSSASDLYGSNSGDLIGTIENGTSTELTIPYDYQYIGLRSADGAMYLTEIKIIWSDTASGNNPPAPTYAVTWTAPTGAAATAGCSIAATVGGNAITSGDKFEEGTVVTITATEGTGYTFGGWTVTGATATDSSSATTTFTIETSDVDFSASFTGGDDPEYGTITITRSSFNSGSLAYNATDTWSVVATTGETITGEADLYSTAAQTTMQTKNTGVSTMFHNTVSTPGPITKITMKCASGSTRTYTAYMNSSKVITSTNGGTSKGTIAPDSGNTASLVLDSDDNWHYFWLNCAGGASFLDYIEIEYLAN